MEKFTVDLKMSEIFERMYYDTTLSKRMIYTFIDRTMKMIDKSEDIMDSDTLFKGGNKNGSYKFKYEIADLFYALNSLINRMDEDYRKDSEFYNIRNYYKHVSKEEDKLKPFQKLVLDQFANESEIEYEIRSYNEIYNSISAIISYMGENKNNEVVLEIINNNLKRCVKEIIVESERVNSTGQKRFYRFKKGTFNTEISKSLFGKSDKSGIAESFNIEDIFDYSYRESELEKISKESLNQSIYNKYMKAIMYIIETFYYNSDKSGKVFDNKKEFYENKLKSFPCRKPLSEVYNEICNNLFEGDTEKYNTAWEKYMKSEKARFRASNSQEWEEYCKVNNITDEDMHKEIRVDRYKEKMILGGDIKKIRSNLDDVFLDLMMKKIVNNRYNSLVNNLKIGEINNAEHYLRGAVHTIIEMINECRNGYNTYDVEKLSELKDNEEFDTLVLNLLNYKISDISITSNIEETWYEAYDRIFINNSNLTKDAILNIKENLLEKVTEYIAVVYEIVSNEYFDEEEISFKALLKYRDFIQDEINLYMQEYDDESSLNLRGSRLYTYSIRSFAFDKTFKNITRIIDYYLNKYSHWKIVFIEIELFDPEENKQEYMQQQEMDYYLSLNNGQYFTEVNTNEEGMKEIFKKTISAQVRQYLVNCQKQQKKYIQLKSSLNEKYDLKLSKVFDEVLGI